MNRKHFVWTPELWQSWREADDPYRRHKSQRDRQLAIRLLSLQPGNSILEVGAGYGWVTRAIIDRCDGEYFAVDRSGAMMQRLVLKLPAVQGRATVADGHRLPFEDERFDRVLCSGVLMHVDNDTVVLSELARVLANGGRLVVSFNNAWSPLAPLVQFRNLLRPGYIQRFRAPYTVLRWLQSAGLSVLDKKGDGVFSTVSTALGRFRMPPECLLRYAQPIDLRLVKRWPFLAYEVWLAALKGRRVQC